MKYLYTFIIVVLTLFFTATVVTGLGYMFSYGFDPVRKDGGTFTDAEILTIRFFFGAALTGWFVAGYHLTNFIIFCYELFDKKLDEEIDYENF